MNKGLADTTLSEYRLFDNKRLIVKRLIVKRLLISLIAVNALWLAGCFNVEDGADNAAATSSNAQEINAEPQSEKRIAIIGDSLSAGYGLAYEESYPYLLQGYIDENKLPYRIVNGAVSGATSKGALSGADWLLSQPIDVLIIAIGANDGLRGLSTTELYTNIEQIILKAEANGIQKIILTGMKIPRNYGTEYVKNFEETYPSLADKYNVDFMPFLLEGVAAEPELNQADGIHPNAQGAQIIAKNVWPYLLRNLE